MCYDQVGRKICMSVAKGKRCHVMMWKRRCRKSCQVCSVVMRDSAVHYDQKTCKNKLSLKKCNKLAKGKKCSRGKLRGLMKEKCQKSCGFCTSPTVEVYSGRCGVPDVPLRYRFGMRIIGGRDVAYGSVPWQAALYSASTDESFCGGVLIDEEFVITAAHCLPSSTEPRDLYVYLGKHHRDADEHDEGDQKINVKKIIRHEDYDEDSFDNDIAILKLQKKAVLTKYVRIACLPNDSTNTRVGTVALVTGFGVTENRRKEKAELQQVDVEVIDRSVCNGWLDLSGVEERLRVNGNMICAGYSAGSKDACQGDSGGPLTTNVKGQHFVVGIVSWGYKCGEKNNPGVYTDVQKYLHWIADNTLPLL